MKLRYTAETHTYVDLDTGEELPYISQMLDAAGLVDDLYMTAESRERGTCVHALTAAFDLGALDPATVVSIHRGFLLGHVEAMKVLRPEFLKIEIAMAHSVYRFCGRPDRIVKLFGVRGTLEIKSAVPSKAHRAQTALQVILDAEEAGMAPEDLGRWVLYLKPNGRYKLEDHNRDPFDKAKDFHQARAVIRQCCGPGARRSTRETLAF